MAVTINVVSDVNRLSCDVTLAGLTVGTRYDILRLQIRSVGDDEAGNPVYQRELPDRLGFWRAVAHRISWQATAVTATFRDYEAPVRPFKYFVVESALGGPTNYTWTGNYPIGRGVLGTQVTHFARQILAQEFPVASPGDIVLRSTSELAFFRAFCVVDIPDLRYQARGTEMAVIGTQFPVYIADSRESRRGSLTIRTSNQGELDTLRRIVFPANGRITPVIMSAGGDPVLLLDDAVIIPLDINIEQATPTNAAMRYVHVDFVEVDPSAPLYQRSGDNDALLTAPAAAFTMSDTTPILNQWITFTDTSTGTYQDREWSVTGKSSLSMGVSFSSNPLTLRWTATGTFTVKLRVYGTDGASTITQSVTVKRK